MPYEWNLGWTIRNFGPLYIPRKDDIINITPADAAVYKLLLEWETGMKVTWDWDAGKVWIGNRPLICHRFQHNYYFMAGDNVTDSNDSRYWGLVPEEYIIGVVSKIIRKK
jgi:signal peptidase I